MKNLDDNMEEKIKTGLLSGDYGKTGIGTVEKYGFKPIIENNQKMDRINPFVDPEMFLGRTINSLFSSRHIEKQIKEYDKFIFMSQDQVSINPADYPDKEIVVYVHDLFPSTTVYNKKMTRGNIFSTIGNFLLKLTHLRCGRHINNADKVVAPCKVMAKELEERTALEDVDYAYQGVDHLPEKDYDGEREIDLIYFGDLVHERKNPEKVYEVFEEAQKKGYTTAYMNHTDDDKIEADHKFIDVSVEKVAEVLSRSRYMLQPSYAEGLGRTPIEAQRYGVTPIVLEGTQYSRVAEEVLGSKKLGEWRSFSENSQVLSILDETIEDRDFENPNKYKWKSFREKMESVIHE